jgi:hypothetical protein
MRTSLTKVIAASTVVLAIGLTSGCGNSATSGADATDLPTAAATELPANLPTAPAKNEVNPDAAKAYRAALEASLAAMRKSGLTELTYDTDNTLIDVLAYNPANKRVVEQDVEYGDVEELDESASMPNSLLDELDGLEADNGTDVGTVTSPQPGVIVVTSFLEETVYVSTYTINSAGLIESASLVLDGDDLGTTKYVYSLTPEAKKAFDAL